MNIEIANRLVELRKKSGLSQEELADKLGLSRQAVSKWERAEASPDTDNLICLAKLYNVSLDDLLKTDIPVDDIIREQKEKTEEEKVKRDNVSISSKGIHISSKEGDEIHISKEGGIHIDDSNGEHVHIGPEQTEEIIEDRTKHYVALGIITSSLFLLTVVAYLVIGFTVNTPWTYGSSNSGWAVGWLVFFINPIVSAFIEMIRYKRMHRFPIVSGVVATYLSLGMLLGLWHPTWIIFFAIPLFYIVAKPIDQAIKAKEDKKKPNIEKDVVSEVKE